MQNEAGKSPDHEMAYLATEGDVDELGHVSNVAYVRLVQEVAKAHSSAVGWDFEAYVRAGVVFVVRRHEIDYLAPAYLGDSLRVITWIETWRGAVSERRTRIVRANDDRELVRSTTTWALVSTTSTRPRRIPQEIVAAFMNG